MIAQAVGLFLLGTYYGYTNRPAIESVTSLYNKEESKPATVDFSLFWEAWKILEERYVDTSGGLNSTSTVNQITDQEKVWGAISGLTKSLNDPYTVFLPPEEKKQFEADISGNFSGVGMEIGIRDGQLVVVSPLPNTPAQLAGIKSGDRIIKIDDINTVEIGVTEAVQKIRGKKGTVVTLTILRGEDNEKFEFKVIRDNIAIPTLETELLPSGVFVIRLYNFSANSPSAFKQALKEFEKSKTDKLLLDLRGNPGGYLEAAIHIASWFLPEDKIVVKELRGKGEDELIHYSLGFDVFSKKLKMAILVDQGSASASEIVAGALAENGIATLVGQKTFGKGSVQELIPLTEETSLKITIARWFTPEGHSISANGLEPEIMIEIDEEDISAGRDPQEEKAVQYLLNLKK